MLDMGFMPAIRSIICDFGMPSKGDRQTLMFSATFPEEIQNIAAEFLNDYIFLTIGKVGGTSSDIEQVIEEVADSEKRERLIELLSSEGTVLCSFILHYLICLCSENGAVGTRARLRCRRSGFEARWYTQQWMDQSCCIHHSSFLSPPPENAPFLWTLSTTNAWCKVGLRG